MGQAKNRKENDPDYGKSFTERKMRGLVISVPMEISSGTIKTGSSLDNEDLRFSLMYWDRLAWPKSTAILVESKDDERFLEHAGILYRPSIQLKAKATDFASYIIAEQAQIHSEYEKSEPGVWAISNGKNSLKDMDSKASNTDKLLTLLHAVPIPKATVPLAEILEFKQKRRDELILFRSHLESLIKEIEESEQPDLALQEKLKEVDFACSNLIKVTREWQYPVSLADFKVSKDFNIVNAVGAISGGEWLSGKLSMGLTEAALSTIGLLVRSQLKITGTPRLQSLKRPVSPFRYAYSITKDFQF